MLPRPKQAKSPSRDALQSQEAALTRKMIVKHHQMAQLLEQTNLELTTSNQQLRSEYKSLKAELKQTSACQDQELAELHAQFSDRQSAMQRDHSAALASARRARQNEELLDITTGVSKLHAAVGEVKEAIEQINSETAAALTDARDSLQKSTRALVNALEKPRLQLSEPTAVQ